MIYGSGRRSAFAVARVDRARPPIRPLCPDLDRFLFAAIGEEIEGVPLSVVSALARLGLDPWEEAGRLSSLGSREAGEQLARLIAELPGNSLPLPEARKLARPLVDLLPNHDAGATPGRQIQIRPRYLLLAASLPTPHWVICGALLAAVVFSAIAHHWYPFVIGSTEAIQRASASIASFF